MGHLGHVVTKAIVARIRNFLANFVRRTWTRSRRLRRLFVFPNKWVTCERYYCVFARRIGLVRTWQSLDSYYYKDKGKDISINSMLVFPVSFPYKWNLRYSFVDLVFLGTPRRLSLEQFLKIIVSVETVHWIFSLGNIYIWKLMGFIVGIFREISRLRILHCTYYTLTIYQF